jgi:hypothetical protein
MSLGGSLVSNLVVTAAKESLAQSLASALAGTVAGSLGGMAGSGMLSGLTFSDPNLQAKAQQLNEQYQQQYGQPTNPGGVTVTAPSSTGVGAAAAPAAATVASGAGANYLTGNAGADTIQDDSSGSYATVAPAVVTASQAPALANIGQAAGAVTGGALAPTDVDELVVTGQKKPDEEVITAAPPPNANPEGFMSTEEMMAAAGLGLGGLALLNSGKGAAGANGQNGGLDLGDLAGLGVLGAGIAGAGGGGGGSAAAGLKGLADNSAALANRLGNVADAGMRGDIGGRGLNMINRMVKKAQAAIRQRYSSMGMSGSTAEMQDLQAAADAGVDMQFKIGQDMAKTGLNAIAALTGQSAQIYTSLLNAQTAKDTALGNALANFAGALAN